MQRLENLEQLTNLRSLYVGKNKITKLEGLSTLVKLGTLSIQVSAYVHFIKSFSLDCVCVCVIFTANKRLQHCQCCDL